MWSWSAQNLMLFFGIFILAACANSTTGSRRPGAMTLSVTGRSPSPAGASAAPVTVTSGSNTLVINQVHLVLGGIELERASADCSASGRGDGSGSGISGNGSDCPAIELDPVLVDVPLDGTATLDLGALGGIGGTVLDPSNADNAFQIGQKIRASFAAFEDDDRNGIEDRR